MKISVITVTYQAGQVLRRTVESVLGQTFPDVEHLIVDGASKDETLTLAFDYKMRSDASKCGHEVIIVSEPDRGIYDAMNKGLARVTGDYVVFMNAGDAFANNDVLSLVARMAESGDEEELPAVVYGDTDIVDGGGNYLYKRPLAPPERLTWRSFRQGMLVCHQAFYARADLAREVPYDLQYRYSADVDWCIRVMKEAERRHLSLVNTHATVVSYLEEGATTKHHRASLKERFRVMCRHYGVGVTVVMHLWFLVRKKRKG